LSDHGAYGDEMGRFFRMGDGDLDRLLAGRAPSGDEELEELAAFLRDVEAAHLRFPPESTEARQLAAMLEAAQLLSDKGEPAARPASKAPGPDHQASRLPKWRSTIVPARLFATIWTKAAVAAVAALLVMAGLASAGALPDPLQTAAANAADTVGVSLDNPGDADEVGDVDAVDDSEANEADDNEAKDDDDAKAAGKDADNGDSHPVSASNDVSTPAPAVTTPSPADDNQADDDNEADDDKDEADDEGAAEEPDHEGSEGSDD
jgi:hypothetical protein